MKSNFEKYLESQNQHLDVEQPDDNLIWEGINSKLKQNKIRNTSWFWKAAAIIIFLVSSTYVFYNEIYQHETNTYNITLSDIEPAYSQQVLNYQSSIDEKWSIVQKLDTRETKQFEMFLHELDDLDNMYREYQEDFKSYGYNEQLVRSMLDYYDKRVRVLDRMLMEIQKQKDYEKRKEEQTEI